MNKETEEQIAICEPPEPYWKLDVFNGAIVFDGLPKRMGGNWFWRLMQRLFLGSKWSRVRK